MISLLKIIGDLILYGFIAAAVIICVLFVIALLTHPL